MERAVFDSEIEHLTKTELMTLYNKLCNDMLHIGSLKDLIPLHERKFDIERAKYYLQKIVSLLQRHKIVSFDKRFIFYVKMHIGSSRYIRSFFLERRDQTSGTSSSVTFFTIDDPDEM